MSDCKRCEQSIFNCVCMPVDELTKANDEIKRLRDAHQKIIDLDEKYSLVIGDAKQISKQALEVKGV